MKTKIKKVCARYQSWELVNFTSHILKREYISNIHNQSSNLHTCAFGTLRRHYIFIHYKL